jgi:hypothetical protein
MPRRPHHVENKGRASRPARPILVPSITIAYADVMFEEPLELLGGRLKVLTDREFTIEVPHRIVDTHKALQAPPNPINQLGALLRDQVPVVTSSDKASLLAAFNKRLNTVHVDDITPTALKEAETIISALPDIFDPWVENDLDRQRWLAKFDDVKQRKMMTGYREYGDKMPKELGAKDLSVKQEVLLKRNDPSWAARIICAGSDPYNALTGPCAMITMERLIMLCSMHNVGGVKVRFAYKTSDVTLAHFLNEDPEFDYCVEGDFSRNDREQRKSVHLLYSMWLRKLGMPEWYVKLEEQLSVFTVQSRQFGLWACIMNQLPTGATITTPRNSAYNLTMFAVACHRQQLRARALILGDDILARTSGIMDLQRWVTTVDEFRMVLKAKAPTFNGQATFLSRRFIVDGVDRPCSLPLIGKAIARFNARGTSNSAVNDAVYMAGKSLSYAYEFRHVPCIRKFFLARFMMTKVDVASRLELTWFTRSNGITQYNIVQAITDEKVLISREQFREWLLTVYDIGLTDLLELMHATILDESLTLVEHPIVAKLIDMDCG